MLPGASSPQKNSSNQSLFHASTSHSSADEPSIRDIQSTSSLTPSIETSPTINASTTSEALYQARRRPDQAVTRIVGEVDFDYKNRIIKTQRMFYECFIKNHPTFFVENQLVIKQFHQKSSEHQIFHQKMSQKSKNLRQKSYYTTSVG